MSANNPRPYASRPTGELEDMLRTQDLPANQQSLVRDELGRRYTEELLQDRANSPPPAPAVPPTPPYDPPPRAEHQAPRPPQPVSRPWVPPPAPAVSQGPATAPSKSAGSILKGCLIMVVLAVVGVVVALYLVNQSTGDSGYGSRCVVPGGGVCPLPVAAPTGSTCSCSDGVSQYFGYVQ